MICIIAVLKLSPRCELSAPCLSHERTEHLVALNGCTDSSVVVVPLVPCDSSVVSLVTEALAEFDEDLVLSSLASLHEWVQVNVENNFESVNINRTLAALVESGEDGVNALLSGLIWLASQSLEESVVVDITVLLSVEVV
jgi:acyl-CoA synthetase (AMP-forming)/AMP-acid ligase II